MSLTTEGDGDCGRSSRRKRAARRAAQTFHIPACNSWTRRKRLEKDVCNWLLYYGEDDPFVKEWGFTEQQREMAVALHDAISKGGDKAIGASRGDGKTTLCEWVTLFLVCTGKLKYAIYFASTEELSVAFISAMHQRLRENDRLLADYPELCVPIRSIEGIGNRAKSFCAYGIQPTKKGEGFEADNFPFKVASDEIHFPKLPGAPCGGAILASRSLTGAVRGLKRGTQRPELAIVDDPDRNLTHNEEQLKKLEKVIERGIGYLGGQRRGIARVMLTSVENHFGVSALFTDPEKKPGWRGKRYRFLVRPPTNEGMWGDYVDLRRHDRKNATELAHVFYVSHRAEMDEGAIVGNPNRKPDGSITGLQWFYNEVARTSREDVETELNNNPPIEELPVDNGLTAHAIQRRISGFPHKVVPDNCMVLTRGVDINRRMAHFVVRAWAADGTGYTIDYDVEEVHALQGSDEGLEEALQKALLAIFERSDYEPYCYSDGSPVPVKATFCDSRWMTGAIRQGVKSACELFGSHFYTIMGCGKSGRCKLASYRELLRQVNPDRKIGEGYHLERIPGVCWEAKCDKERFVLYEHSRWMAPDPGGLWLYGEKVLDADAVRLSAVEKGHLSYAKHIVNEKQIEEMVRGVKKLNWKASNMVHYLDASCYASVGAVYSGVVLPGFNKKTPPAPLVIKDRPTRESLQRYW